MAQYTRKNTLFFSAFSNLNTILRISENEEKNKNEFEYRVKTLIKS